MGMICLHKSFAINVWQFTSVWDEYHYLDYRYWTNEYPNIFSMIRISRMNIQINSPWKNLQIFWQMNIFVQNILTYSNIRLYAQDCFGIFGDFHILSYFGPILTHFGPIITIFNNFWETLKSQMYSLSYILEE